MDTLKDTAAGAAGGVAQVLIGQPFDLVKVRLQANGGNALTVARDALRLEGPRAFYKGTLPPLIGVGACVSVQFGAFTYFHNVLEKQNEKKFGAGHKELSLPQIYLAGGAAGLTNSVISGPIEHIRIRLQTQPHGNAKLYYGPIDCVRKIYQQAGIAGIYRGQVVTLLREFHGYGVWFAAYEGLVRVVMKMDQKERIDIPSWKFAVCGGLAGELLWLLSHPLDVIKSKMQSDGFGAEKHYQTMRDAFKITYRMGGIPGLFNGLVPALLRAMPVSAGTFATVELVKKALGKGSKEDMQEDTLVA